MTDSPSPTVSSVAVRFARLVMRVHAEPAAVAEHRADVKAVAKALKKSTAQLVFDSGVLSDGGEPLATDEESVVFLAERFGAYGLEKLELAKAATDADLYDLVKLLSTAPTQADPLAFFAARAAAIDARAIPRTLKAKVVEAPPEPLVEQASAKEHASAKDPVSAKGPASAPSADPRSERLTEALEIPESSDKELAALFATLATTEDIADLRAPLERLAFLADLAFRTGKFERMLEALTGLVAIEFVQLERDASDERRREFASAVRRLASPVILRQLAVMRHLRADDPLAVRRLQAVLYRYGTDGAEALIDEWMVVASPEARAICLDAVRTLRRSHDALFDLVRSTDPSHVRRAVELLGALGDARAEQLLLEQIRHPDARTRRAVVAALEGFASLAAFDAIAVSVLDDDASVRLRAVSALGQRGNVAVPVLAPLLEQEPELEVHYAAVAALGSVGSADAVQVLIRCANGETAHPRRRSATLRLQACAALALVRTPQAMAAIQLLRDDRDREVREGSARLVAQASRRSTTTVRAIAQ